MLGLSRGREHAHFVVAWQWWICAELCSRQAYVMQSEIPFVCCEPGGSKPLVSQNPRCACWCAVPLPHLRRPLLPPRCAPCSVLLNPLLNPLLPLSSPSPSLSSEALYSLCLFLLKAKSCLQFSHDPRILLLLPKHQYCCFLQRCHSGLATASLKQAQAPKTSSFLLESPLQTITRQLLDGHLVEIATTCTPSPGHRRLLRALCLHWKLSVARKLFECP